MIKYLRIISKYIHLHYLCIHKLSIINNRLDKYLVFLINNLFH